ncbi:hypothetical protein BBH88_07240 [Planococcus antarcticus DSM 14505]|uniref:Polysaccharide biosynthesis protein C-terminal domain-containing protein n=1 Tax=Planococcus antarcticus DSM 14505 TaxID=1185653 RepID=A0ABN4RI77_9BACL|nr:oligosaccharide flippase family protein [Planococcus antarcticus]ANU10111.1 hypothetical protein BBH88_07240 [Planococcus antarcticus DSM 14505]
MIYNHSLIYLIAKGLPGIVNIIFVSVITKIIAPNDYGIYITLISYIGIFNILFFEWISSSLLRFYKEYEKDEFLATCMKMLIVSSLMSFLISSLMYVAFFTDVYSIGFYLIFCFSLIAQGLFNFALTFYRAKLVPFKFLLINLSRSFLFFTLAIILIKITENGLIIGFGLSLLIPIVIPLKKFIFITYRYKFNRLYLKQIIVYGIPLLPALVSSALLYHLDRIMISSFKGYDEVAVYAVASTFSQSIIVLFVGSISAASFPLILKALKNNNGEVERELKINFTLTLATVLPLVTILVLYSHKLTSLLLSPVYSNQLLIILPLFSIAAMLETIRTNYFDIPFKLTNNVSKKIIPVVISLIFSISLNLYLIPKYGVLGAVITAVLSYSLALIISYLLGRKIMKLPIPFKELLFIFVSLIPLVFLTLIINPTEIFEIIFTLASGIILYVLIFVLTSRSLFKTKGVFKNGK